MHNGAAQALALVGAAATGAVGPAVWEQHWSEPWRRARDHFSSAAAGGEGRHASSSPLADECPSGDGISLGSLRLADAASAAALLATLAGAVWRAVRAACRARTDAGAVRHRRLWHLEALATDVLTGGPLRAATLSSAMGVSPDELWAWSLQWQRVTDGPLFYFHVLF